MLNKKIASEFAFGIIVLLAVVVGGIFWMQSSRPIMDDEKFYKEEQIVKEDNNLKSIQKEGVMCTQDAKQCSDGKIYVSRTGPNCEFAKCPESKTSNEQNISPLIEKYSIKEFTFSDSQKISKIEKKEFKVLEHFSVHDKYDDGQNLLSIGLSELGGECSTKKSDQYYTDLLSKFSKNDLGFEYRIYYKGESNMPYYAVTIIPNKPSYYNNEQFREDFGTCYAGGNEYPRIDGERYLLFVSSCGSGFGEENDLPYGCDEIKKEIEPSLKVF